MAESKKSKHTNKRNDTQKAKDRELITRLRLMRWTVSDIAKHEDLQHISYDQIYYDLKKIENEWKKQTAENIDSFKRKQLQALDTIISEAFKEWEKSKKPIMYRKYKDVTLKDTKDINTKLSVDFKHDIADNNCLKRAIEAIQEQNKLLGLHSLPSAGSDNGSLDELVKALDNSYEKYMNNDDN